MAHGSALEPGAPETKLNGPGARLLVEEDYRLVKRGPAGR
jgi:hypothetical protein